MSQYDYLFDDLDGRAGAIRRTEGRKQALKREAQDSPYSYLFDDEPPKPADPVAISAAVAGQTQAPEAFNFTEAADAMSGAPSYSAQAAAPRTGIDFGLMPDQFKSGVTGLQQNYYAGAGRNAAAQLNILDRVERGEPVKPNEDALGYAEMDPATRSQIRNDLQSALGANVQDYVRYGQEKAQYRKNPRAEAMINQANNGDYSGAWKTLLSDPLGIVQQLSVESTPNMLPSLAGGAAGLLLRGGVAGMMTGLATGSFPVEFMAEIGDLLGNSGIDVNDIGQVEAKLRDPKFVEEAGKRAVTRATVIAAADAAGGRFAPVLKAGQPLKNTGRAGVGLLAEVGTEGGGEALAQQAVGDEFKAGDVLAEMLGAGPQAAATTAMKTIAGPDAPERQEPEVTPEANTVGDTTYTQQASQDYNPDADLIADSANVRRVDADGNPVEDEEVDGEPAVAQTDTQPPAAAQPTTEEPVEPVVQQPLPKPEDYEGIDVIPAEEQQTRLTQAKTELETEFASDGTLKEGEQVDLKLATPESVGEDRYNALNTIALALKRAFDVDVLLADFGLESGAAQTADGRQIGGAAYHGWYAGDGKTVVLNVRSDRITDTLAHEPYHVLEQRFPDLFAPIFDLSMDSIDPAALKKMAETYGLMSGQLGRLINALATNPQDAAARVSLKAFLADPANLKKTKGNQKNRVARSEIVAHVVGQMATPKMYTELVKRTGSAQKADEILKVIGDYLKAVYNALTGKQLKFVKGPDSIKQIRSAMQQIQNEWQSRTAQQRAANKPTQPTTPAATQTAPQTAQKPAQAAPETVEVEAPQPPAKKPPRTAKKGGAAEAAATQEAAEAPKAPPKKAIKQAEEPVAEKPAAEEAKVEEAEKKPAAQKAQKQEEPAANKPAKKVAVQRSDKSPEVSEDVQWAREQLDALSTLEGVGVGAVKKVAAGMARRGLIDTEDVAGLDGNPEDMVDQLQAYVSDARLSKTKEKPAEKGVRSSRTLTNTPEFKEWFGNSKVVDESGDPLVVYHGTRSDFSVVDTAQTRRLPGFWVTPDPALASSYAANGLVDPVVYPTGANVMPLYVRIERPYRFDRQKESFGAAWDKYQEGNFDGFIEDGNDAVGVTTINVKTSDQIKSATGNVGPFGQRQPTEEESARVGMTQEQAVIAQRRGDIRLSRTPLGFYSALADGVEKVTTNSSPAVGWKAIIKGFVNKGQVKQDEVDWSGINDWLDLQKGKVSKEAVKQYLDANGVQVEETVLGAEEETDFWVLDADGERMEAGNFQNRAEAEAVIRDLETNLDMEGLTIQEPKFAGMVRYGQYGPPGGENYREVLLRLPGGRLGSTPVTQSAGAEMWIDGVFQGRNSDVAFFEQQARRFRDNPANAGRTIEIRRVGQESFAADVEFKSSHWDQPNVLAHLRVDDRTDADGKRTLFIREIQSDWGQDGKKKGFQTDDLKIDGMTAEEWQNEATRLFESMPDVPSPEQTAAMTAASSNARTLRDRARQRGLRDGQQVPVAPFVTKTDAWVSLALKRAIIMATQEGYDKVAIVNGQQAAEMFSLDKELERINWSGEFSGNRATIQLVPIEGGQQRGKYDFDADRFEDGPYSGRSLEAVVGKEIAEKIASKPSGGTLSGEGLKVEAKGMRAFYDTIVPTAVKKLLPKVGGGQLRDTTIILNDNIRVQVAPADLGGPEDDGRGYWLGSKGKAWERQPAFDITPEMREKVSTGLPLFSKTLLVDGVERPTQNDRGTQIHPTVEGVTNFWREFADAKTLDAQGRPQRWYHGTARNILAFRPKQAGATFATQSPKFAEEFAEASEDWMTNNATQFLTARQMQEARDFAAEAFLRSALARTMTEADREKSVTNIKRNTPTESWHDVLISRAYRDQLPTNANIIPVYINATNPFDYENPDHIAELNRYEEQNRYTDRTISEFVGPIQRGNWQAMEATGVQDAIKAMGHDGFYVMEGGNKNLGVYDTTKIKSAIGNVGTFGNRLPTAEEAARLGMTEADAADAQAAGDIRLSKSLESFAQSVKSERIDNVSTAPKAAAMHPVLEGPTDLMRMVGLGWNRPVILTANDAVHAMRYHPEITPQFFGRLPALLERPRAVMDDQKNNSKLFLLDTRDPEGRPIVAVLKQDKIADPRLGAVKVTLQKTAYGLDDAAEVVIHGLVGDKPVKTTWMAEKEIARVRGLFGASASATPPSGDPFGPDLSVLRRQDIKVLSDSALVKYRQNPNGDWRSEAVSVDVPPDWKERIDGVRLSKTPIYGDRFTLKARGFVEEYLNNTFANETSRVANVQQQIVNQGGALSIQSNFDVMARMQTRKAGQQMERFRKTVAEPLAERAAKNKIAFKDIGLLAYALHAPARNKDIAGKNPAMPDGGSGMTDAEARQEIIELSKLYGARYPILEKLALDYQAITGLTRKVLVDAGLIDEGRKWNVFNERGQLLKSFPTKDDANNYSAAQGQRTGKYYRVEEYVGMATLWEEKWGDTYVPLKGFEDVDEEGKRTGATDPRQDFSKRALGRRSRAANILETILADHERAIKMAGVNNARKAFALFVAQNPDNTLWERNKVVLTRKFIRDNASGSLLDAAQGMVQYQNTLNTSSKDTVAYRVGGELHFITVKDEGILNDINRIFGGEDKAVSDWKRAFNSFNRYLGRVYTTLSPVFTVTNFLGDVSYAAIRSARFNGVGAGARVVKDALAALPSIARAIRTNNWTGGSTKYEKFFNEMREVGGVMGITSNLTVDFQHERLMDSIKLYQKAVAKDPKTWGRPALNMLGTALNTVEAINSVFEQATRVAVYTASREAFQKANPNATARETERNKLESADAAANATVDFARRGKLGPVMSGLYLFFNPAIQGLVNFSEVIFGKPTETKAQRITRGSAVAGSLFALGWMMAALGAESEGEDDKPYWDSADNDDVKRRNLVFFTPEGGRILVPMPYQVGFVVNMGSILHDAIVRGKNLTKSAWDLADSFTFHFSPFGSTANLGTFAAPTILDPLIVIGGEKTDQGRPLMPVDRGQPDSERYWPVARGSLTQRATTWLNEATGGNSSAPGVISVSPNTVDYLINFATGGAGTFVKDGIETAFLMSEIGASAPLEKNKIPFVKRVYRTPSVKTYQATFYDAVEEVEKAATEYRQQGSNPNATEATRERISANQQLIALDKTAKAYKKSLKVLRDRETQIIDSDMSVAEKDEERKRIDEQKQQLYVNFNRAFYRAKED